MVEKNQSSVFVDRLSSDKMVTLPRGDLAGYCGTLLHCEQDEPVSCRVACEAKILLTVLKRPRTQPDFCKVLKGLWVDFFPTYSTSCFHVASAFNSCVYFSFCTHRLLVPPKPCRIASASTAMPRSAWNSLLRIYCPAAKAVAWGERVIFIFKKKKKKKIPQCQLLCWCNPDATNRTYDI